MSMNKRKLLTLGIDPDLHSPAFAIVSEGEVLRVGVGKVPAKLKGWDAVHYQAQEHSMANEIGGRIYWDLLVVEGQEIYPKSKARPNDLLRLAFSAGIQAAALNAGQYGVIIAQPKDWTRGVRKDVRQARQYKALGWDYQKDRSKTYAYPTDPPIGKDLTRTAWKHIGDAIGLALWGAAQ